MKVSINLVKDNAGTMDNLVYRDIPIIGFSNLVLI